MKVDINELLDIKDSYQAPEKLMSILYDKEEREQLFHKFLKAFDYDVSYDWFHEYFEDEHADRKKKKQDFTPNCISDLLGKIVGHQRGMIYEPATGTGGIIIRKWNQHRLQDGPFMYEPNNYLFWCEDLSDRALPFLLFNLIIRGINAVVIHCDVLTRESYGAFLIQNEKNDYLRFSNFNVFPYNDKIEELLQVKFIEERYKPHVENSIEACKLPQR